MNLTKGQRIRVYNAQILAHNARRELDETIETIVTKEDKESLIQMSLRLQGIVELLKGIIKASRDET